MEDENKKTFRFGNERFGGSYTPGDFEIKFPEEMSREDFERMFTSRMEALHKRGNDFAGEFFDKNQKTKKEKLKPLSIRVKPHTKEFFKNHSLLSPRDVLEIYENFNNGSEAFINSLIEDEKELQKELLEVQEKLHNAKLFREKLSEMDIEIPALSDKEKILKLKSDYENTEIKVIGNESSLENIKEDIIKDIQTYNTLNVEFWGEDYLIITVYTKAQPILYYFKNEYSKEDISQIIESVEEYCKKEDIEFKLNESYFDS